MKKIGFIGLGVMGYHMALNLSRKSGMPVTGFDISKDRLRMFEEAGGTAASSAEEIYSECDIILQMLPTAPYASDDRGISQGSSQTRQAGERDHRPFIGGSFADKKARRGGA